MDNGYWCTVQTAVQQCALALEGKGLAVDMDNLKKSYNC